MCFGSPPAPMPIFLHSRGNFFRTGLHRRLHCVLHYAPRRWYWLRWSGPHWSVPRNQISQAAICCRHSLSETAGRKWSLRNDNWRNRTNACLQFVGCNSLCHRKPWASFQKSNGNERNHGRQNMSYPYSFQVMTFAKLWPTLLMLSNFGCPKKKNFSTFALLQIRISPEPNSISKLPRWFFLARWTGILSHLKRMSPIPFKHTHQIRVTHYCPCGVEHMKMIKPPSFFWKPKAQVFHAQFAPIDINTTDISGQPATVYF